MVVCCFMVYVGTCKLQAREHTRTFVLPAFPLPDARRHKNAEKG